MAIDWKLKWPEDVLLATVVLKGLCKHIRGHACVKGAIARTLGPACQPICRLIIGNESEKVTDLHAQLDGTKIKEQTF